MNYFITLDFAENGQFTNKKGNWKIKLKLSRRSKEICQDLSAKMATKLHKSDFSYHFDWTATLTTIWKHCAIPNCLVHFLHKIAEMVQLLGNKFWLTLGWGVGGGSIIFQKAGGLAITTILANITGTNNSFQNLTGSFKIYFFILAH